jgi:hypothetical protein
MFSRRGEEGGELDGDRRETFTARARTLGQRRLMLTLPGKDELRRYQRMVRCRDVNKCSERANNEAAWVFRDPEVGEDDHRWKL